MLHIVNGDSVADKLRQGVVQGEILVWREVYPHGPVFVNADERGHRAVRAEYLEQTMGIPRAEFIQGCEQQEQVLADFQKYEEIVLWFKHDLFDQTMLCHLLHWFSEQSLSDTKLSLLSIGEYPGIELFRGLGQLSVEQMQTLSGTWKSIGEEELRLGRAFWEAYTSKSPELLQQLLDTDTSVLPYAHAAFQCHLARFPSTQNGLGIVEQTTLEAVRAGIQTPKMLFKQVGDRLNNLGMGDLEYWYILRRMSQDPYPLLEFEGSHAFPDYGQSSNSFHNAVVRLTDFGSRVADKEEDWITKQGIDAWYGGVHLQGNYPQWRWDTAEQKMISNETKE
ncbi:DUF1835 domain-containing protein [Paenibacillus sp. EC2-1]|uniref:DUF1835 domain-containing protein n=1 Tax=Paenibacillus sp. EC2-1 TaxID=3388665 RepID=UPI003BEECA01